MALRRVCTISTQNHFNLIFRDLCVSPPMTMLSPVTYAAPHQILFQLFHLKNQTITCRLTYWKLTQTRSWSSAYRIEKSIQDASWRWSILARPKIKLRSRWVFGFHVRLRTKRTPILTLFEILVFGSTTTYQSINPHYEPSNKQIQSINTFHHYEKWQCR